MQNAQTLKLTIAAMSSFASQVKDRFLPESANARAMTSTDENLIPAVAGDYDPMHKYQVVKMFPEGSEGQTGLARIEGTNRLLVIKHCIRNLKKAASEKLISTVPEEAKTLLDTLSKRTHTNIIRAFGYQRSYEKGRYFLFLEYCSGEDLLSQLNHFWKLPASAYHSSHHAIPCKSPISSTMTSSPGLKQQTIVHLTPEIFVLHTFISLVQALYFIHGGYGGDAILHRDIKAENVLLRWPADKQGLPDLVLADFGAAQLESSSKGVAGTPGCESPEVAAIHMLRDSDPAALRRAMEKPGIMTRASDIYSLGHLMYHMTSCREWRTGDYADMMHFPREYGPLMCGELETAVRWCLEVRAEKRPSAGQLMALLDGFRNERARLFEENGRLPREVWKAPGRFDDDRVERVQRGQRDGVTMPAAMPDFEAIECGVAL